MLLSIPIPFVAEKWYNKLSSLGYKCKLNCLIRLNSLAVDLYVSWSNINGDIMGNPTTKECKDRRMRE